MTGAHRRSTQRSARMAGRRKRRAYALSGAERSLSDRRSSISWEASDAPALPSRLSPRPVPSESRRRRRRAARERRSCRRRRRRTLPASSNRLSPATSFRPMPRSTRPLMRLRLRSTQFLRRPEACKRERRRAARSERRCAHGRMSTSSASARWRRTVATSASPSSPTCTAPARGRSGAFSSRRTRSCSTPGALAAPERRRAGPAGARVAALLGQGRAAPAGAARAVPLRARSCSREEHARRSPARRSPDGRATSSWAALIENPAADNPVYRTHAEAMTEILKAILTGLEQDARPPARSGARRNAGRRAKRAARHTTAPAGARLSCRIGGCAAALRRRLRACSTSCRRASRRYAQLGRVRVLQSACARSPRPARISKRRWPIRSSAPSSSYAAIVLRSLRDLFQKQVAVWAGLSAGLQFARWRLMA